MMRYALLAALALTACVDKSGPTGEMRDMREKSSLPTLESYFAPTVSSDPLPADDGQWTMPARDYASRRFSSMTEINRSNVANLRLAWTFSDGSVFGHEAGPLVVGTTMYVITPFPNEMFAIDLTQPGGVVKWKYKPPVQLAAQGVACCDKVNRGAVFDNGRIYFNTLDNQVVALDAATGREAWRVRIGDINKGETMTMAPLVVKGKVLVGNSGGEMGVRGWLTALDAATGEIAWRAYSTGPDADVLIGPNFKPYYSQDQGSNLGVNTWPPGMWEHGGGTVWGWISYDPELDLIYYGTGNPGPWNPDQRPGANKWTSGIFARDPDNGEARWFYQWSPHDVHDYDGVNENVLVDLPVNGTQRKILLRAERNGYIYLLDRATGQVLSADAFAYVNSSKGVDLQTGKLQVETRKSPKTGVVVRDICPASPGAKDWQPTAWSPRTQLLYIPHNNLCMDHEAYEANYIAGTPYVGANVVMYPGPGGHRGEFTAWDPVQRKPVWKIRENFPVWSGALATAGDVVFYGTMDRWFKAVDATSGKLLWQFRTASGIIGQPITYRGPDGKQYIAIFDGVGGWAGAVVSGDLSQDDPTVALGFANAMKDLPRHTERGGTLYVFTLP